MASVITIPEIQKDINLTGWSINDVIDSISKSINSNDIDGAWQIILNWKINNE